LNGAQVVFPIKRCFCPMNDLCNMIRGDFSGLVRSRQMFFSSAIDQAPEIVSERGKSRNIG
jgi:hypothetical protein